MAFSAATAINDAGTYPVPALAPPAAGAWYTDPVFGTRIQRVTDASTADSSSVPYAYWPSWNCDSTRFWVNAYPVGGITSSAVKTLWNFDPVTGALSNQRSLQVGGDPLASEGLIWSRVDPALLFGFVVGWTSLYTLTPGDMAIEAVPLRDRLRVVLPTAHSFWQMSMGGDDRYFCWSVRDGAYQDIGIAVYDCTTDTLVVRDLTGITSYDEAHLTRDGALVVISSNPGPALLWDWQAHPIAPYLEQSLGGIVAHEDMGPTTQMVAPVSPEVSGHYAVYDLAAYANGSKTLTQAQRGVANLHHPTATADWPSGHWTWQNLRDPDPALVYLTQEVSTDQRAAWRPYFDEIWRVCTTDTGVAVRRLAHHRSEAWRATSYYASVAKGAVDTTGRWLAYTSNWQCADLVGGNTRTDVYILKIPTDAEFSAGDYASDPPPGPEPPPTGPTLTVSATEVKTQTPVTVTLIGSPGGAYDWLALSAVGAPPMSYLTWIYVGVDVLSRLWTVTMPKHPGSYEFRLFLNNGYMLAATSPTVVVKKKM